MSYKSLWYNTQSSVAIATTASIVFTACLCVVTTFWNTILWWLTSITSWISNTFGLWGYVIFFVVVWIFVFIWETVSYLIKNAKDRGSN